jgi:hypothetical protein
MHESQDELDLDLKQSAPGSRLPDDFKRNLRMILKSRYAGRQRPFLWPAVAIAAGMILLLAHNREVDSGDFHLEQTGVTDEGQAIYRSKSLNTAFLEHGDLTKEQLEDWNEQLAANKYVFYKVEGVSFQGRSDWTVFDDVSIDGQDDAIHCRSARWPLPTMVREDGAFYECCLDSLREMVDNNKAEYLGTFTMRVNDTLCQVKEWRAYFEGYGAVHYYRGEPIR